MAILTEHTPQFYLGEMTDQFTKLHRLGGIDTTDTGKISGEMARCLEVGKNLMRYLVVKDTGFSIVLHANPDVPVDKDILALSSSESGGLEPGDLLGAESLAQLALERCIDTHSDPKAMRGDFYYGNRNLVVAMSSLARVIGDGRCSARLVEKSKVPADTSVAA